MALNYEVNVLSVILFLAVALDFILMGYVIYKNPKNNRNQICALLLLVLGVWVLGKGFISSATTQGTADSWTWLSWAGAAFIPSMALHFSMVFSRFFHARNNKYLWALHIPGFVFYYYCASHGAELLESGYYDTAKGYFGYTVYTIYLMLGVFLGLVILGNMYVKTKNLVERWQIRYMYVGMIFAGGAGALSEVVLPTFLGIHPPPVGGSVLIIMGGAMGYSIIKYKLFEIEAVVEAGAPTIEVKQRLEPGFNYLIKERDSRYTYEIFRGMVTSTPGLALTTFHPQKLRREYTLEKTPIIWLTETETSEKNLSPTRLDFEIMYNIEGFIKDNDNTTVLVDDIKYLSMTNGFEKTLAFIKSINDVASIHKSSIMVPVNAALFDESEMHQIENIFDEVIDTGAFSDEELQADVNLRESYAYLIRSENTDHLYNYVKRSERPLMVMTKTFPGKIRTKHGINTDDFYWLSETTTDEKTVNPGRIDFEVTSIIGDFLRERRGLVAIDDLDSMVFQNGFEKVSEFLKTIIDIASETRATIIVHVDPKSHKEEDVALLERRFDVVIPTG